MYRQECHKKITVTLDKPLFDQMQSRMETHKGKRMMKQRQSTVEPVLGTLINYLGMKRVNTIGIKQAGKCMLMAAVAYNLKKLLRFCKPKAGIMIKTMGKSQQKALKTLFSALWIPLSYIINKAWSLKFGTGKHLVHLKNLVAVKIYSRASATLRRGRW